MSSDAAEVRPLSLPNLSAESVIRITDFGAKAQGICEGDPNRRSTSFPTIQHSYEPYGAGDTVKNAQFGDEGARLYETSKRMAAYPFLAEHLDLDLSQVQYAEERSTNRLLWWKSELICWSSGRRIRTPWMP